MQDFLKVTGMVIGAFPQGEYDRRIELLTRERGKITAFVKGARRQGSRFTASTDLFTFGTFDLYVGKNSYNVQDAVVQNYFEFLRSDMEAAYYGMYFLELAGYYAVENSDETMLLLLLYRALQGLKSEKLENNFVRRVFETKLFILEGEFIPIDKIGFEDTEEVALIEHIRQSSIEKLFNFRISDQLFLKLEKINDYERKHLVDRHLSSLDILDTMIGL